MRPRRRCFLVNFVTFLTFTSLKNSPGRLVLPNIVEFMFWPLLITCQRLKSVCIQSYSGPYFPAFGLNTKKYGPERLRIWTCFTHCALYLLSLLSASSLQDLFLFFNRFSYLFSRSFSTFFSLVQSCTFY